MLDLTYPLLWIFSQEHNSSPWFVDSIWLGSILSFLLQEVSHSALDPSLASANFAASSVEPNLQGLAYNWGAIQVTQLVGISLFLCC